MKKWLIILFIILISGCTQLSSLISDSEDEIMNITETIVIVEQVNITDLITNKSNIWDRQNPGYFIWGRIENEQGIFDYTLTDAQVLNAQENNVNTLAVLWPYADWDQTTCHSNECQVTSEDLFYPIEENRGLPIYRCKPCNMTRYLNFVSQIVERYDGDGINDMPGLIKPVLFYEILNEVSINLTYLTFFKGSGEDYYEIAQVTSETIKNVCPDCMIVQGGVKDVFNETLNYWSNLVNLGIMDYFDIVNVHHIMHGDESLNVRTFNEWLTSHDINKPLWVTEAEVLEGEDFEQYVNNAYSEGASLVFLNQLIGDKSEEELNETIIKEFDMELIIQECDLLCNINADAYCQEKRIIEINEVEITGTCRAFSKRGHVEGFNRCEGFCNTYPTSTTQCFINEEIDEGCDGII